MAECWSLLGAIGIAALLFQGSIWLNYLMIAIGGFGIVLAWLILIGHLADYLKPEVRSMELVGLWAPARALDGTPSAAST